jgi:hypothetical protein
MIVDVDTKIRLTDPEPSNYIEGVDPQGLDKLLPLHFSWVILGPPESGKTTLTTQIIKNPTLYANKFDDVWFFCEKKIRGLEGMMVFNDNWATEISMDWFEKKIEDLEAKWQKEKWSKANYLIVFDDV